jgi:hypothetical protein
VAAVYELGAYCMLGQYEARGDGEVPYCWREAEMQRRGKESKIGERISAARQDMLMLCAAFNSFFFQVRRRLF